MLVAVSRRQCQLASRLPTTNSNWFGVKGSRRVSTRAGVPPSDSPPWITCRIGIDEGELGDQFTGRLAIVGREHTMAGVPESHSGPTGSKRSNSSRTIR